MQICCEALGDGRYYVPPRYSHLVTDSLRVSLGQGLMTSTGVRRLALKTIAHGSPGCTDIDPVEDADHFADNLV